MTSKRDIKKRFYFIAAEYFRFFANFSFKRWHPRVIAITGSVGKTTMLHLVEQQLGKRAHYSHDANSAFGVTFDMLGLRGVYGSKFRWFWLILAAPFHACFYSHKEEFYVVEVDGERPHEAEFLAKWLRQEVTLWISLGRSHAIQFEKQVKDGIFENIDKAITHEFAMLPQYTTGKIYIDGDVPLMVRACEKVKLHHNISAEVVPCFKSECKRYSVHADHTDFTIGKDKFHFYNPMPADLAIQLTQLKRLCDYLDVKVKTDFKKMPLPPGRNSYFEGKNGLKLIDSSYNAHLISMEAIMEMVSVMKEDHKWLVVGDMVEQGEIEKEEHEKLAQVLMDVKPEQVILIGRRTEEYTAPILKKHKINVFTTREPREALKYIEANTKGGEAIVFKGSQYLEWIIEKLLKNPDDRKKLARRNKAAVRRRKNRGLDS
jgi:UDP-N-acetylmuramoyl-tripeptide--D-alanyl-D-alanine ligase